MEESVLRIALELGKEGAKVVVDYHSHPASAEEIQKKITASGSECFAVQADVAKPVDLQKLVDGAVQKYGRLDIWVNNAGIETRTSILDTNEAQYDKVLQVNLKSAFFGTQLAAKQMIKQGGRRQDHQHHIGP